jgi:hypothetical protein
LYDITGFSSNDVYAVGRGPQGILDGIMLHYDGSSWNKVPNTPSVIGVYGGHYQAIWGTGPSDIYILGYNGDETDANKRQNVVFHWNGVNWTDLNLPSVLPRTWPSDIWGYGNELWVIGGIIEDNYDARGVLYHFDGNAWTVTQPLEFDGPSGSIRTIDGVDACHMIICGNRMDNGMSKGVVVRWDGITWNPFTSSEVNCLAATTSGPHNTLLLTSSTDNSGMVGLSDGMDGFAISSTSAINASAPRSTFRIPNTATHFLAGDGFPSPKISHADCQ